jgi:myo-inositol-1(or 4)-monophosphatase
METARAAGAVLLHYTSRDKQIELKGRADLVTVADRESEALIVNAIRSRYPDHGILAEESGVVEIGSDAERRPRWIVDPLDGTTNFAHGFPAYSVSIGFETDGQLECGVVFDPVRDEMFHARRGSGAWLNDDPIHVSEVSELPDALLLTGFPYGFRERPDEPLRLFRTFLLEAQAVRRAGSAAIDLCYVAAGRSDGFWELGLRPWDTAAGVTILRESGGRTSDFSGGPFSVDRPQIVASNGRIHEAMLQALSGIRSR